MRIPQYVKSFLYNANFVSAVYFRMRGSSSFSKNNLDLKLAQYLNHRKGTYVEIGANDGIQQSNSKYFETFLGWKGVLIEPFPENFTKLQENRAKRNHFVNSACVDFSYSKNHVDLIYSDLMTTSVGLESDLLDMNEHLKESEKYLKRGKIHSFTAEARTMNSILVESGMPKNIDFLSLDVEGAEISVLKGIDHEQYRFKYILVECRNLDSMCRYLEAHGYSLENQFSQHDYLFKDKR